MSIEKYIKELAEYTKRYNDNPSNKLILYNGKKEYIKSILSGNNGIFGSCTRGSVNLGNICYMNAALQLLNTIPGIRYISRYEDPENDKYNSYLRAVFDELNNPVGRPINLRSIVVNGINVYDGVLLEAFRTESDRIHGDIKSAHEWLESIFETRYDFEIEINRKRKEMKSIDENDEINNLKSISYINEINNYCKDISGRKIKEHKENTKLNILQLKWGDTVEIEQTPIKLSKLISNYLDEEDLTEENPSRKCRKDRSFVSSNIIIPKNLTHIIISLTRESKINEEKPEEKKKLDAWHKARLATKKHRNRLTDKDEDLLIKWREIEADIEITIDDEIFRRQGVIWYSGGHYTYYLYTENGIEIERLYNDDDVNFKDTINQLEIHAQLLGRGLIYLYRRVTNNHEKEIVLGTRYSESLKSKFREEYNKYLLDPKINENTRKLINLDVNKNILSSNEDTIKVTNIRKDIPIELLNEFTSEPSISALLDNTINESDFIDKSEENTFKNSRTRKGELKYSVIGFIYPYIKIKTNTNLSEQNKNLLINKMLDYDLLVNLVVRVSNYIRKANNTDKAIRTCYNDAFEYLNDIVDNLDDSKFSEILDTYDFMQIVEKITK
jgi:hypothetical protein